MKRGSGILLHISSLPGKYGVGEFGRKAYDFADFLGKACQRYWQLLPLNPTDPVYGNSPYSSPSAFAMNTLFIDLEDLVKQGWMDAGELKNPPSFSKDKVTYVQAALYKDQLLSRCFHSCHDRLSGNEDYRQFCLANAFWLEDYSHYVVLKQHFNGLEWNHWPQEFLRRDPEALARFSHEFKEKLEEVKFRQYVAFKQFLGLREYCLSKRIQMIGDIPIYVNFDSADVWAHPKIFKLDDLGRPTFVAGVPPDYFSTTGQRWGNPVYNWDELKKEDYDWWMKRIQHNLQLFDVVRIDHFRGLIGYWQIPVHETTAVNGQWEPGPGDDFFYSLKQFFGEDLPIIAEDLGVITPDVTEAMQKHGFPGMKVLVFAFGGDLENHPYIPENYKAPCVVYTGTHDNNTVQGWFHHEASAEEKKNLKKYLGKKFVKDHLPWTLVQIALKSTADMAVIPLQDILGLDQSARMNVPGTGHGNWEWRVEERALTPNIAARLKALTKESHRISQT